jgi:uncharacterized hydrophobic protein (TIGR00271 family)
MANTTNVFHLIRKAIHFLRLEAELQDTEIIHEEIAKGIQFKGTNLWILMFAIIVASVGLNMNSTAVIIGAMLISPLMGPINGIGYSIATYNFELFQQSIKNFGFAVLASLFASTVYFALSPISTAHSELLARTSPTIYDVLIALFGGLAGIIAISSKLKGNVIPGVAIATALMPPLCTAGYGLATMQLSYFFGAFYLFTINTIFIAFASLWVSQLLKLPIRIAIAEQKKKRINQYISIVIIIVLLPSIYFGYELINQEKFTQNASLFVSNVRLYEGNYLLKHNIDAKNKTITLVYGGNLLNDGQKITIAEKTKDFKLRKTKVIIEQGLTFSGLDEKTSEVFKLKEQVSILHLALDQRVAQIDSLKQLKAFGNTILQEVQTIYPQIIGCSYAETYSYYDPKVKPQNTNIVILSSEQIINKDDQEKIFNWLKKRLKSSNVKVFYENTN